MKLYMAHYTCRNYWKTITTRFIKNTNLTNLSTVHDDGNNRDDNLTSIFFNENFRLLRDREITFPLSLHEMETLCGWGCSLGISSDNRYLSQWRVILVWTSFSNTVELFAGDMRRHGGHVESLMGSHNDWVWDTLTHLPLVLHKCVSESG